MNAHPHPNRFRPARLSVGQGSLRVRGGPHRVSRRCEGSEERVTFCVDFHTAVASERGAEDLRVRCHDTLSLRPERVQETGGALDVGEEERYGPGRQPRHRHPLSWTD